MKLLLKAIIDLVGNIRKLQVKNNINKNGNPWRSQPLNKMPAKSCFLPPAPQLRLILCWILSLKQLFPEEKSFHLLRITFPSLLFYKKGREGRREGEREEKKREKKPTIVHFLPYYFLYLTGWSKDLQWNRLVQHSCVSHNTIIV